MSPRRARHTTRFPCGPSAYDWPETRRKVHPSLKGNTMKSKLTAILVGTALCTAFLPIAGCESTGLTKSAGASTSSLSTQAKAALSDLKASNPAAAALAADARGILVFPKVIKGGLVIGAMNGEGAMIQNNNVTGYYDTSGASYGLQAGAQSFSYALFFMSDEDMTYLNNSSGWEVGVGPSVVVVDSGIASSLTTTTARKGVYCFFFDQKGLMAGLGIQGTKITRLQR